jgi:hypothetical protein
MPQNFVGSRSTNQAIVENRLVRVPDEDMLMLEPNNTPLVQFMIGMKRKEKVDSPRIEHGEDDYTSQWVKVTTGAAASAGATTITLVDNRDVVAGDMLLVPQAGATIPEQLRVVSVGGSNQITVARNTGGTGLRVIADGAQLLLLGQAYEEGSTAPVSKTTVPVQVINYTQIFKRSIQLTGTQAASKQYFSGGNERTRLRNKMMQEFKIQMNRQFLFGQRSESLNGGPNGNPIRTNGGLNSHIVSNRFNAGGLLTRKFFEAYARRTFRYGNKKKVLLASSVIISAIHEWGNSFLKLAPMEDKFGVALTRINTGHGEFALVRDWALDDGETGQVGFSGYAFAFDPECLTYRFLKGRDTKMYLDGQQPTQDAELDYIQAEAGIQVRHEKRHSCLFGVDDYAA